MGVIAVCVIGIATYNVFAWKEAAWVDRIAVSIIMAIFVVFAIWGISRKRSE